MMIDKNNKKHSFNKKILTKYKQKTHTEAWVQTADKGLSNNSGS